METESFFNPNPKASSLKHKIHAVQPLLQSNPDPHEVIMRHEIEGSIGVMK